MGEWWRGGRCSYVGRSDGGGHKWFLKVGDVGLFANCIIAKSNPFYRLGYRDSGPEHLDRNQLIRL